VKELEESDFFKEDMGKLNQTGKDLTNAQKKKEREQLLKSLGS